MTTEAQAPTVTITFDEAVQIVNQIGSTVALLSPTSAGAVALATGGLALIAMLRKKFQSLNHPNWTVLEQAELAVYSARNRLEVGAAPAAIN